MPLIKDQPMRNKLEFIITEYCLPRHWGVGSMETDEHDSAIEHTYKEYRRFSSYQDAENFYNLLCEKYLRTGHVEDTPS